MLQRLSDPLGDVTGDGFVGADDLSILIRNWNNFVGLGNVTGGDITGDGYVGADDLAWMIDNWNAGTPPPLATAVPEPASMAWLALLVAGMYARRVR